MDEKDVHFLPTLHCSENNQANQKYCNTTER